MSSERPTKRASRRRLTEDEHKLWSGVARSVSPLKRKTPAAARHDAGALLEAAPRASRQRPETPPAVPPAAKPAAKSPTKSPVKPVHPPITSLASLDRRQRRRLARGVEEIEARIDLHGKTQSEAHVALLTFLQRAQADGVRFALVITGKGGGATAGHAIGRGVLKRQVPQWLRQAEFRAYVLGAEDAHRAHGGEGALYIRLRRGTRVTE